MFVNSETITMSYNNNLRFLLRFLALIILVLGTLHLTAPMRAYDDADTDGDGLPDSWENQFFGNLDQSATDDPDADQCSNLCEYNHGANPMMADTDADGLLDGAEVNTYHTDPTKADTD